MPNLSSNYSVNQMKQDLGSVLHGTSVNSVQGINNIFNRTARQFLLDLDPQETMRKALTPAIFRDVWDYSISNFPDIKGNRVVDVRPQVARKLGDVFGQTYEQNFDVFKNYTNVPNLAFHFDTATKSLRVDATQLNGGVLLNQISTITGNGTWAAAGGASSLANDTTYFVEGGGSLSLNTTTGGYIENSTMANVDMTNFLLTASGFIWIYLNSATDATNLTSVNLRWGSSASNYYTLSQIANFDGSAFHIGWNQLQFNWQNLTPTGSPTLTAYNYERITFTTAGTINGIRVNTSWFRMPTIYEILYYSKYLFRDSTTGVFAETVASDNDLINLDTETLPLFFNLLAYYTFQQSGGDFAAKDMEFYLSQYKEGLARYQALYKSQTQTPAVRYYRPTGTNYTKYMGQTRW